MCFNVRLCLVCCQLSELQAGVGREQLRDAASGERVGTEREGMERSLGKLYQSKRLLKLRLGGKCFAKTNLANSHTFIYQDSSFSGCVFPEVFYEMVWC